MIVVTTGSRKWTNYPQIALRIEQLRTEYGAALEIVNGVSKGGGADAMVKEACDQMGIKFWPVPVRPDLDGHHRGAPLNRNKRMILTHWPKLVIAFRSEGESNGTDFTINLARSFDIPVEINHETL